MMHHFRYAVLVLLCTLTWPLFGQDDYHTVLTDRASKIVATLGLHDTALINTVTTTLVDQYKALGVVHDTEAGLVLEGSGFAPRQGFEEMSWLFAQNLHDHAAAAVANLQGEANFLEQSVFVDELTAASAERLREVSVQAWRAAFRTVMQEAQQRFDADQTQASAGQRRHRARFGVYFYSEGES